MRQMLYHSRLSSIVFFFAFSIQNLSAVKVVSQLWHLLHVGAGRESYSSFAKAK